MRVPAPLVVFLLAAPGLAAAQPFVPVRPGPEQRDPAERGLPLPSPAWLGKACPAGDALGAHPDAAFQRRLRDRARALAARDTPGVALWSEVVAMAVEHYRAQDDLTVAERFDRVMRDAGAVLVGERPLRSALNSVRRIDGLPILRINGSRSPVIDWLEGELARMDDDLFAGMDLDVGAGEVAIGSDFRSGFQDGTRNQVYHSFFYVLTAYFTGNHHTTGLGNLFHELHDPGGSAPDYDVGNWAARMGEWLRRFRDDGNAEALDALPSMLGAMFADDPQPYAQRDGRDFSRVVGVIDRMVSEHLGNPGGGLVSGVKHRVYRGAIRALDWIKGN